MNKGHWKTLDQLAERIQIEIPCEFLIDKMMHEKVFDDLVADLI
ncbi:MAG: hypothetical protein AB7F43_15300 [Bacteriovoracia bacterium]